MGQATDIDALIDELIEHEGGYVNHAADRGGATRNSMRMSSFSYSE